MKKTLLYDEHVKLGARMAEFGGYEMPIQYTSVLKEHNAARTSCAIFDTCHMGEFIIEGKAALSDLERLLSCDVESLKIGSCRYGFICNHGGGVIDDQIIYRLEEQKFLMVVNSSTEILDFNWVKAHLSSQSLIKNISPQTAKLDIQGPQSPRIIQKLLHKPIDSLKYFQFSHNLLKNEELLVSRTGYTGELGFEIYCSHEAAVQIWNECIESGVTPAGLAARNTLRLEMGYPLYGHELNEQTNAAQSGFTRAISTQKEFIGSEALRAKEANNHILAGISTKERKSPREGDKVSDTTGKVIGFVTSGSYAPSLQCAVALAYIGLSASQPGTAVKILNERQSIDGEITELPFYKSGTARKKIEEFL